MTWHDRRVVTRPFCVVDLGATGLELTVEGLALLMPALRRPWASLDEDEPPCLSLVNNPLGDAGVRMVAELLPHTLAPGFEGICHLDLSMTSCGDDGLVALAAALPALVNLRHLECRDLPDVTSRGWVALADALPSLPAIQHLWANDNPGVGTEGALAFAKVIFFPRSGNAPFRALLFLERVDLENCRLSPEAKDALQTAEADRQQWGPIEHFHIPTWDDPGE